MLRRLWGGYNSWSVPGGPRRCKECSWQNPRNCWEVHSLMEVRIRAGLFFGRFSGKCRVVDLPEIWGFWRFYLEFWVNFWVFEQICLILDKICYIWLEIFSNFWKICRNFEFWAKNSWVLSFLSLSFSFFHLEFFGECPKKAWTKQRQGHCQVWA